MIKEDELSNYFEGEYEVNAFKRFAKIFYDRIYIDDKKLAIKELFILAIYMLCHKNKKSIIDKKDVQELFRWLGNISKENSSSYFNIYLKLNKNDDYIIKEKDGLSLTIKGFQKIKEILSDEFPVRTFIIKKGEYYKGRRMAQELIFNKLSGMIRICDPYIAVRTFDLFTEIQQEAVEIRILTASINESENTLKNYLDDFQKQYNHKILIKKVQNKEIHDRYLIFNNTAISFGTSLKDIGNKDTIITYLPEEIIEALAELFDIRWNDARPI